MVLTPLGKFLSSPSSDEYNSSQNPVIIYFDSKSGDEQLDFSIHTPHIVDEQPPLLLTAEEPEKEAIAQTNKLTLHNISKVL